MSQKQRRGPLYLHGTRQNTWHDRRHRHRPSAPISPVAALPYQERKQAAWQGWGRLVTWVAPQSRVAPPRPHQRRRRAPSRAPWRPQRPSPRCQPSCGPARRAAAPASSCPAARRRARPAPGSCPARTPAGPRAPRRPARRAARGQGLGHSAYPHNDWRECAAWLAATTALARTCPAPGGVLDVHLIVALRTLQALGRFASGVPAGMAVLVSVCVQHVRRGLVGVDRAARSSIGARARWRAAQTCRAAASVFASRQAASVYSRLLCCWLPEHGRSPGFTQAGCSACTIRSKLAARPSGQRTSPKSVMGCPSRRRRRMTSSRDSASSRSLPLSWRSSARRSASSRARFAASCSTHRSRIGAGSAQRC